MRLSPLLLLLACQGAPPMVQPSASKKTQEVIKPQTCAQDQDCTQGWHPGIPRCGPLERCLSGRCILPPAITGEEHPSTGLLSFETSMGEQRFKVEVMDSYFERGRGMMCRREMKSGWGMLFLMPSTQLQSFWMRNTLISLDMVFLDRNWVVAGVVERAEPQTIKGRRVGQPSLYVLELSGGAARAAGIRAGVQARYFPPSSP